MADINPGRYTQNVFTGRWEDTQTGQPMPIGWMPSDQSTLYPTANAGADMMPKTPAAPAPTTPTFTPTAAPKPTAPMSGDLAMNQSGTGETFFGAHKDEFTKPGLAQGVAENAIAKGGTPTTNNAQTQYGMFASQAPADMSQYYANAERQAIEGINKRTAATGSYGSSAANDMTSEALMNLAADRAKAEAGYGLQRAGLGGQLASAADQSSLAGSADQRAWTLGIGNLALGADSGRLAGLTAGTNAADAAQNARENRIGGLFSANLRGAGAQSDVIGAANRDMFGNDMNLFGSGVAAGVAPYSEGAANAVNARAASNSDREETMKNSAALAKLFKTQ